MMLLFYTVDMLPSIVFCFSSSPLKVKEDDEVDKLEIKIKTPKRSKSTYPSPSPEVTMKISRSLRVSYFRYMLKDTSTMPHTYAAAPFMSINIV